MSDAGEIQHKRSRSSAALSLLRRKDRSTGSGTGVGEEDVGSEDGSQAGLAMTASATSQPVPMPAIAYQQSQPPSMPMRGHASRMSTGGASLMSRTSAAAAAQPVYGSGSGSGMAGSPAKPVPAVPVEKGHTSLEQSVRKFRIVEALRSGDTAFISKTLREAAPGSSGSAETAGPRGSTSSVTSAAAAAGPGSTSAAHLDDTTIVHLAIQCAELPVVEYVLSEGAGVVDLNARDKDGNTPLHLAASQGRTQVVRLLLDRPDVNDAVPNLQGRLPLDLARNPEIFQLLQLSRSLYVENKVREVQELIVLGDYQTLAQRLEEPRFKTVLDINSSEFASDPVTVQTGGTLLHEAARRRNAQLIQVLLLHGADPFRRDRKGKLPQDVTKDDVTRAMLKKSPAAVAAQRGIQEKAVLGAAAQGGMAYSTANMGGGSGGSISGGGGSSGGVGGSVGGGVGAGIGSSGGLGSGSNGGVGGGSGGGGLGGLGGGGSSGFGFDAQMGKEAREMKGYLKKWTNYRKGYQLRFFVLEDGVLSYYKHQDDANSACRGAINMRIARLHMSADEKTKFEIIGKSSVKYTLKANHEVEAKRWFWALNNSIQWTKDQAKEEERQRARDAELLRQAKAEHTLHPHAHTHPAHHSQASSVSHFDAGAAPSLSENASVAEGAVGTGAGGSLRQSSYQLSHVQSTTRSHVRPPGTAGGASGASGGGQSASLDDEGDGELPSARKASATAGGTGNDEDDDEDDDYEDADGDLDGSSGRGDRDAPRRATRDAFNITAQSAKLQLETMAQVNQALVGEATRNPALTLSDARTTAALSTYDAAIRSLTGLMGDLVRISRDRDAFWQYRLDREVDMRRMWEESMAQVAREQEALEARVGEAEEKKKTARRILKEVIGSGVLEEQPAATTGAAGAAEVAEASVKTPDTLATPRAPSLAPSRRQTAMELAAANLSDSESEDEEFFDAVDAGEVAVVAQLPSEKHEASEVKDIVVSGIDISKSFKGYESGIRTRLKLDADNRPKLSLWSILKSMVGKDMTKMTLPVSFNEPTSLLYRCCEDMEYADLLDQAAERSDSIERLMYVAAFAASEYASTIGRVAKPFNPLLGETFEYVRPDKNYRFFIEQVSHHPPVGAAHAESPRWTYYGESAVKSKFYGKSFDINPLGTWFLRLRPTAGGREDFYTWKKVTSSVVGIITGNPTVDNYGPMEIKNWTTGEVAHVEFKPRGWTAASAYLIAGKIVDASGRVRVSLGGRWNSRLYARLTPGFEATVTGGADEEEEGPGGSGAASSMAGTGHGGKVYKGSLSDQNKVFLIWQANERPKGIPFNLTPFVVTFNHIDENLRPWLAPTDSRLRPDQRAMEEGAYDFAATEKDRLEREQRARRQVREQRGEEFVPAYFSRAVCEITGESYWKFNGQYWEDRDRAGQGDRSVWDRLEPLFTGATGSQGTA